VASVELKRDDVIAYREAVPDGEETGSPVVFVHGFPESSRMWEPAMEALAAAGRRCLAPDLYGLGDSTGDDAAQTFEHNLETFGAWIDALGLERVALVVHDWGGFIGLAWACEHPDAVEALVISDTGFFADGKWHGMAEAIRGEQGEQIVGALDRDGFAGLLRSGGDAFSDEDIDAYWRPFAEGRGQRATLDFYRSMDFEKLAPYEGKLGELGVPTLLLWGADDPFAPLAGAHRFEREIPGAELVAEQAGHFVWDEQSQRCAEHLVRFLADKSR
jgi:pimeloyl-ACP methyl ester carboxylesterase